MATLTTLRNVIAAKIGLDNTASSADQVLIDEWVNQGVTQVLLRTHCKVTSTSITLEVGTSDYTLDTAIMQIVDLFLTSGSQLYMVERRTVDEILNMRRSAQGTTAPSLCYAVAGSNLLMVYPTPASADVITAYYVPRPATLSSGSETPSEIPVEFHKAIEYYALAEAADYDDDTSSGQGELYRAKYEIEIVRAKRLVATKGGARLAPLRVNPRRSRYLLPHDPSTDLGFG